MSKNEFICDCNIIHEDIVKDTWADLNVKVDIYTLPVENNGAQIINLD